MIEDSDLPQEAHAQMAHAQMLAEAVATAMDVVQTAAEARQAVAQKARESEWIADIDRRALEMAHAQTYRDACQKRDAEVDARHEREVCAVERIAAVLEKIAERGYGLKVEP